MARRIRTKYRSDLQEFVFESKLEDFAGAPGGSGREGGKKSRTVLVSTIHKAKGREFDSVWMLLRNEPAKTDDACRRLYMGMTRTENRLFIHCNTGIFEDCRTTGVRFTEDAASYPEPRGIRMHLMMDGMVLSFSRNPYRKKEILRLRSGSPLTYSGGYLLSEFGQKVAKISRKKLAGIQVWESKGYAVAEAKVGFIVAWKNKEETEETSVLLPSLVLCK